MDAESASSSPSESSSDVWAIAEGRKWFVDEKVETDDMKGEVEGMGMLSEGGMSRGR